MGIMKRPDGTLAASPEEAANLVLDKAFPKSVPLSEEDQEFRKELAVVERLRAPEFSAPTYSFLSETLIKSAFKKFKDGKSAFLGPFWKGFQALQKRFLKRTSRS